VSDRRQPIYKTLYFQVLFGIVLGVVVGVVWPATGEAMRPLGDGFIKLIRMLIAPIIFTTITVGIAQMGRMKDVSRIGLRALLYFEVVSTLALVIGLVVVNVLQPGAGLHVTASEADIKAAASYGAAAAHSPSTVDFLLNIIPTTVADAFVRGDILQVLFVSTLAGIAMLSLGERAHGLVSLIDQLSKTLFTVVAIVMRAAPIGAFGAMAFTVGRYGVGTLFSLGKLMGGVYVTCLLFVIIVLGSILRMVGLRLLPFSTLHPRRDPPRARDLIVGIGAAAHHDQARATRVQQAGGGARRPGGLLVQPWTARLSTCRWRRSSSRRRAACTCRRASSCRSSPSCC
jgi:aerobic C4-dicarboxylate transport protein